MKEANVLIIFLGILFRVQIVFGQQTETERVQQEQQRVVVERRIQEQERILLEKTTKVFNDQSLRRGVYRRKSTGESLSEESEEYKLLRAPNPIDLITYKDFLSQPKTGLFRLFPDLECESKLVVRIGGGCGEAVSHSWSYSFRQKDYSNDILFDVKLKGGNIISDSFHSQGILVDLGNVPLENILIADEGIKFLVDFKPETRLRDARNQFLQIEKGIASANYFYAKSVKAKESRTYAARLIAYKKQVLHSSRFSGLSGDIVKYLKLNEDQRIDLIIAFRIIRKDGDGNLTILWKELNRQNSPKLVFGKNDTLSDIKPGK